MYRSLPTDLFKPITEALWGTQALQRRHVWHTNPFAGPYKAYQS